MKRLERPECEFRTESAAADIGLPPFQGGAGLLHRTRSFASGYVLSAASPPEFLVVTQTRQVVGIEIPAARFQPNKSLQRSDRLQPKG